MRSSHSCPLPRLSAGRTAPHGYTWHPNRTPHRSVTLLRLAPGATNTCRVEPRSTPRSSPFLGAVGTAHGRLGVDLANHVHLPLVLRHE